MLELSACPSCQGFNPPSTAACLHCARALEAPRRRPRSKSLWTLAGAGLAALTLMACYGAPPCDNGTYNCYDPEEDGGIQPDAGGDAGR